MNDTRSMLLAACLARKEDDAPWGAYADLLHDLGDSGEEALVRTRLTWPPVADENYRADASGSPSPGSTTPTWRPPAMSSDEEAFLLAVQQAPEDDAPRLVFADWLDERGREDEADRYRRWRESKQWLEDFANSYSWASGPSWESVDYATLMAVARSHCEGDGRTQSIHTGDRDYDVPSEFWAHFEVVTGLVPRGWERPGADWTAPYRRTEPDRKHRPSFFRCAC
jgi:uncharacterized protein (TIGR02996 family)